MLAIGYLAVPVVPSTFPQGSQSITMKYRVLGLASRHQELWKTAEEATDDDHMIPTIFTEPGETLQILCTAAPHGEERVQIEWSTNALWRTKLADVRQ